jgi:glycolate oxidase FAD binding subunit
VSALRERLAGALGTDALAAPSPEGPPVVTPATIEAASEALRLASRDGLRVLPAGAATHLGATGGADFVLSATRLRRVLEHEPEDLVAVVEAGVPLAALDARLAAHAQRVAPDPWATGESSVGGAVAANRCGLARRARGTWRDAVLGARVVHADGRISKTGGRVVKNVAGFDLQRLYVGSRGSLVWIAELSLRLVPRATSARTFVQRCPPAVAFQRLLALHRAALAPEALLLAIGDAAADTAPAEVAIAVRFEGRPEAVQAQADTAARVAGAWAEVGDGAWDALRRALEPRAEARLLCIASLPTAGAAVHAALAPAAPYGAIVQFGVGIAHAHLPPEVDLAALRVRLASCGARATCEPPHPAPVAELDPVARALAIATKQALDPLGVFPAHPDLGGTP